MRQEHTWEMDQSERHRSSDPISENSHVAPYQAMKESSTHGFSRDRRHGRTQVPERVHAGTPVVTDSLQQRYS